MTTFVDTSALYALLDSDDNRHQEAEAIWARVLQEDEPLVAHNYVLVETTALVQRRLGMEAVRTLHDDLLPLIELTWVDEAVHAQAMAALMAAQRRHLSLVDRVSFEVMRRLGIQEAFAFDQDFTTEGFRLLQ